MASKRIFISFDYDNDRDYRYLLSALNENTGSEIEFEDLTPEEIQSYDVGRIKAALSRRLGDSTHLLTIVGNHANDYHEDWREIGERNWQWWEADKAKSLNLKLVSVKIESSNTMPEPLLGAGATQANSFNVESILNAINSA